MYFVDNDSAVSVMPTPEAVYSTDPLWFTRGGSSQRPTYPGPDWMNTIQAEMINVLAAAGIALKKDDNTQLSQAIGKIISTAMGNYLATANNLSEIAATGADAQSAARQNLGLGDIATHSASEFLPSTYSAPVTSVNGKTGAVTLAAADVHALPDTYIPPPPPVTSVNGKTGAVTLAATDIHALPDTYVPPTPDLSGYETIADANARFIQGVQLGAEYTMGYSGGSPVKASAGGFLTGIQEDSGDNEIHTYYFKPVQININGTWATIAG